jgi:hypothetical protein
MTLLAKNFMVVCCVRLVLHAAGDAVIPEIVSLPQLLGSGCGFRLFGRGLYPSRRSGA